MANKFWIDSMVANKLGSRLIPLMEGLFEQGYTAVAAEPVIDIGALQEDPDWFKRQVEAGKILLEAFYESFDDVTSKAFTWSSAGITTAAADTFGEAIEGLPNEEAIHCLSDIFDELCIEQVEWIEGRPEYKAPGKLSPEAQKILGLPEDATRTEVLAAAEAANRVDLFEAFNASYVDGLARQHDCAYVLGMDGVTELPT